MNDPRNILFGLPPWVSRVLTICLAVFLIGISVGTSYSQWQDSSEELVETIDIDSEDSDEEVEDELEDDDEITESLEDFNQTLNLIPIVSLLECSKCSSSRYNSVITPPPEMLK